ncbi:tRNA (guanosine(46)-N(7))-methyltransferase TrmB [Azospirillum sp. B4]|uniref:tRNA (guanine(46)-N(7))-methyltransferase TrmB n=1 Tax=Azospirillum sp. B4 TaxID=95605 RepID=UPI0005C92D6F|nr:tRNA (guanine(46)-N(7))-methyltransferase TrmB [Azospirillum sp. B4]
MTDDSPAQHRPLLYGRRRGRPLRQHRTSLIEGLLPHLQLDPPATGGTIDPAALFPQPKRDLWFEVGFGGGEHLAQQAAANPDIGFIGCEPFINGVANLLQHIEAQDLSGNIRVCPDDARPILDALPEASVGRVFVLFADPWPKLRHAERRFIGPANLPRLARVLKDGAELRLATDDPQLCRWMLEHAWRHPDFEWLADKAADWRVPPADWVQTRYEQKALEAGRVPVYLRFRRKSR